MGHIFVWTFKDIFGLAILATVVVVGVVGFICVSVSDWLTKRRKKK